MVTGKQYRPGPRSPEAKRGSARQRAAAASHLRDLARLLLLLFLCAPATLGQAPPVTPGTMEPGAIQKHSSDTLQYYENHTKAERLNDGTSDPVTTEPHPVPVARAGTTRFFLSGVRIGTSEVLSDGEIRSIVANYVGRQVTLADLDHLVNDLNALYAKKGYVTARALLPPQVVRDNTVQITLVEGRMGQLAVKDKTHTRPSWLTRRIHLKPGDLIRLEDLQKDIVFLNQTTDLKVRAILQPGRQFGTTDVGLQVKEPEEERTTFFFDNAGRDAVGRERIGIIQRYASILGLRDPLTVGTFWANGTLDGFASYQLPVGPAGTRVGANVDFNHIHIMSGPLEKYAITGRSVDASIRVSQPLLVRRSALLNLTVAPHWKMSTVGSNGIPLSMTQVRSAEVSTDLQAIDRHGAWIVNNTLSGGLFNLAGTHVFFKYNAALTRVQNFNSSLMGMIRLTGQVNGVNSLPALEQFQVGGLSTVRGYTEGRQIGDRGYAATAELQYPVPWQHRKLFGHEIGQKVKGAAFVDHGAVFDSPGKASRPEGDDRYLTSAGFGVIVNLSRYFAGRFDWAVPLRNRIAMPDVGFHFYLQSNPQLATLIHKANRAVHNAFAKTAPSDAAED